MKITNRTGLPQPIVDAIKADTYSRGEADISVTQLIDPPQKVWIEEQHADEIEEDASDMIWALLGNLMHLMLAMAESLMPVEKRLFAKCGGWTISGAMDRMALFARDLGVEIQDYKLSTVWAWVYGDRLKEWTAQLNVYAWLARQNGYDVRKLSIVLVFRDWSKLEAKRKPDYPQSQVMVIDVPMWSAKDAGLYVSTRVALHNRHRNAIDQETSTIAHPNLYRHCTAEERWERPTRYAVMKEGRKSALRVLESRGEAFTWAISNGHARPIGEKSGSTDGLKPGISIVERPSEAVRCESYCNAARWCPQYQGEKDEQRD